MESTGLTEWNLKLEVREGAIERLYPCSVGGSASSELYTRFNQESDGCVTIESHTSRRNPLPVNGLVVEIDGSRNTRFECRAESKTEGKAGACEINGSLGEILGDDLWGMTQERFSSPKVRVGRTFSKDSLRFRKSWTDPEPREGDSYILKALQKNGQVAWVSPKLYR